MRATYYFWCVAMSDKRLASARARLPVVAVVVACVCGIVAAVAGGVNPVSAVRFALSGHWVYNPALGSVFHVDGSTGQVDARARVPGEEGDQVFQGDTSGYVVGSSRITEFGKSNLSVASSTAPPSRAMPEGVETAGGPYLVYREDGKVVRLGEPHAVLSLGGPVGSPVATRDGTLWLPRTAAGLLCQLRAGATQMSCPVLLPKGHAGALTVVGDRPVFVDTTRDTVHAVADDGLGAAHALGVDVPDGARLASTDVAGRVAILDGKRMYLVDAGLGATQPAAPVTVDLDDGDYAGPVSTGRVVAVVNRTTGTLLTYDVAGKRKQSKELPASTSDPRLTRGEDDRVYVDGAEGSHVVVVDEDGDLTDVPITDGSGTGAKAEPGAGHDPDPPVAAGPPSGAEPQQPQPPHRDQPAVLAQPKPNLGPPVAPPSPPGAPPGVNAVAGNASATVNWGAAPDNRSTITGYRIGWAGGSTTAGPGARAATIPGLANGTSYVFTVVAVNGVGAGPGAASNPVIPAAPIRPASAPANLKINYLTGTRNADLTWDPPADLGGGRLVHYLVSMTSKPEIAVTGTTARFNDIAIAGTATYTVKAVTADAAGREVVGAPGTRNAPIDFNGTLTISQLYKADPVCGADPNCGYVHITLRDLEPNTNYDLFPHWSNPANYHGPSQGAAPKTDKNGNAVVDQFPFAGVGDTVYVTAKPHDGGATLRSNDLVWRPM
jgi:hypothetical protein